MVPEQADALLFEEPSNLGEFALPNAEAADEFIAEFEADSAQADELIRVVDTVGRVAEVIEQADDKAIDEHTAAALGVAVEDFCRMAGLEPQRCFAAEQFAGGPAAKRAARQLALEGLTDVVKRAIEGLIKFLRRIINYLYDTMQELLYGADNILRAAQEVQERARGIAHKHLQEGGEYIADDRLTAFFSREGRTYSANQVLPVYKAYSDEMKRTFSAGFMKEVGLRVHETLTEAAGGESKEATEGKINKIMLGMKQHTFAHFTSLGRSDIHETQELKLPFGERRLVLMLSLDGESGNYTGFNVVVERAKSEGAPIKERKLETMNYEQIFRLAKEVENQMLFGLFKSYKSSKSELGRIKNAIEKGCEQIARDQQSTNRRPGVAYSVNFLKDLASALVSVLASTHKYDIMVARSLLTYCDRSIKQHV